MLRFLTVFAIAVSASVVVALAFVQGQAATSDDGARMPIVSARFTRAKDGKLVVRCAIVNGGDSPIAVGAHPSLSWNVYDSDGNLREGGGETYEGVGDPRDYVLLIASSKKNIREHVFDACSTVAIPITAGDSDDLAHTEMRNEMRVELHLNILLANSDRNGLAVTKAAFAGKIEAGRVWSGPIRLKSSSITTDR